MNQMSQPTLVHRVLSDGVLTLTLGAAPAHPLSLAMIDALRADLDAAADDPDVRVVMIVGDGRIFCAGHDLKEIAAHRKDVDHGRAYLEELFGRCGEMMITLARMPQPTIAQVHGIATAGGLQLMAACDLAFAATDARFCLPGVVNGGFCTTPAVAVSRKIAHGPLMDLMLSGEVKDTGWALNAGLITRVFAPEALAAETAAFAATLATRNPGPIAAGKAAVTAQRDMSLEAAYAHATPVMVSHFMDEGRLAAEREKLY